MVTSVGVEFAIGSATGLLDCVLFHWVDTLKVRRQDGRPLLLDVRSGLSLQRGKLGLPRFIGVCMASLYAGFTTNVSLKVPYMASMFAFNALNSQLLSCIGGTSKDVQDLASAALVGVEVSLMLSPLEMVRIQGQNCGKGGIVSASRAVSASAKHGAMGWWHAWTRGMTYVTTRRTRSIEPCCQEYPNANRASSQLPRHRWRMLSCRE